MVHDALHLDVQAVHGHFRRAAVFGNAVEGAEYHAAQRVVFLFQRQVHLQRLGQGFQVHGAGDPPQVVAQLFNFGVLVGVKFVVDVADDLLQQVLHGHDAAHAAVFVHDDGQMRLLLLHVAKQRVCGHGFGYQIGTAQQLAQGLGRVQLGVEQEIAGVEHAYDIIDIAVIYREAAQAAFTNGTEDLLAAFAHMQGHHIHAVHHHVGRGGVVELKDVFDHGALILLDGAVFAADIHHHADLLLGDFLGGIIGVDAQEAQHSIGGDGEQPHQGQEEFRHAPDDRAGDAGDAFGVLERDALGHQFAQHDHEIA